MTIEEIYINNYRSIQNLKLPLGQVNVITGPNASGKSNLYKAVNIIAQAAKGNLAQTLANEGGLPSILWAGERKTFSNKQPVRLVFGVITTDFSYEIQCGLPKPSLSKFSLDPEVKEEAVWFGKLKRPGNTLLDRKAHSTWIQNEAGKRENYSAFLNLSESVLSQLHEPHRFPELSGIRHEILQWRFYHYFSVDERSPLRTPQIGTRTVVLSDHGNNVAAALQTIIEIGDHDKLYDFINLAFPNHELVIDVDKKSQFEIQLNNLKLKRTLSAKELSDGTLRYLCLLAVLLSPRPPPLLVLNEPETSLHPDLLPILAELITEAAKNSQIWLTTHAPEFAKMIAEMNNERVINLKMTESGTQIDLRCRV